LFTNGIQLWSKNRQKGFSLVELIMVMVLLGILSATVMPRFFDVNTFREQAFFDDTLNAVRYAQKLAVATGCRVQVSVAADTYTLNAPADRSQCFNAVAFPLAIRNPGTGDPAYTNNEPGVALTSTAATFTFDALGRASADVTLTVAGNRTITVVGSTGFVF
jgi:MSHA pilin protein MshC